MATFSNQIRRSVRALAVVGVTLGFATAALAADFEVVANKSVPVSSVGKAELQSIFLGEKTKWDDGKPIKIVVLEGGPAHKAFLQNIAGKTPSQFDNYWKKLVFTGKASTPKSFGDSSKLVEFVSGHPGAIGYVATGESGASVKTVSAK